MTSAIQTTECTGCLGYCSACIGKALAERVEQLEQLLFHIEAVSGLFLSEQATAALHADLESAKREEAEWLLSSGGE